MGDEIAQVYVDTSARRWKTFVVSCLCQPLRSLRGRFQTHKGRKRPCSNDDRFRPKCPHAGNILNFTSNPLFLLFYQCTLVRSCTFSIYHLRDRAVIPDPKVMFKEKLLLSEDYSRIALLSLFQNKLGNGHL